MNIKRIGKEVTLIITNSNYKEDGFEMIPGIKFSEISHTDLSGWAVSPWSETYTLVGSVPINADLDEILNIIEDYMLAT